MISYSKILEFHHTLRKTWKIDVQGGIGPIKIRPYFDRPNLTLNVNMSGFPQSMIKFKYFWLRNQSQIKNQSRGTLFFAPFKFCPFLVFLGQKWTKKRPDPIFLELCECFLMSYMICQKVEKIPCKIGNFSVLGGLTPKQGFWGPRGSKGGKFSLPPTFGHRASMFSRKNWGVKIFVPKRSV